MAMDYSQFRVELRRHIGMMSTPMGNLPFEHPQKIVLIYPPDTVEGAPKCRQAGYLSDHEGASLAWLPDVREEAPPQLIAWVEKEAQRLKDAGEFVDPPSA